jgi:peptidyl-prolyl cis-trans isomerase D
MLRFLREKGNTWLLKGLLGFVALTFVTWGGLSMNNSRAVPGGRVAAWVNEIPITIREFENRYYRQSEAMRRQLGEAFTPELEAQLNLRRTTFSQIVMEKLQIAEAARLGLEITDAEVAFIIQEQPSFQNAGRFDPALYRRVLQANRLNPRQFEEDQRRAIAVTRLRGYIGLGATLGESEVRSAYRWANEKVRLESLRLTPAMFSKGIEVKEEDLKAQFEKTKASYRVGERRRASWWYLPYTEVSKTISLSGDEIREHYGKTRARYTVKESVTVEQILIKLAPDAKKEKVEDAKVKISGLLAEIVSGKSFAELAKAHSEGPAASKGGKVGTFERGQMLPELEKVAFALKAEELSGPVQTSFGMHLLRVGKRQSAGALPFEEVKEKVKDALMGQRAQAEAKKRLKVVRYDVEDKKPAQEPGGLRKGTSDYFAKGRSSGAAPEAGLFGQMVFSLAKKGSIAQEKTGVKGVLFVRLEDIKPSAVPEFGEVAAQVRSRYVAGKAAEAARKKAEGWLAELRDKKKTLEDLAEEVDAQIARPKAFGRGEPPVDFGRDPGAIEKVFKLGEGEYSSVRSGLNVLIVRSAGRPEVDMSKYKDEKKALRRELFGVKQRLIFLRRMDDLRKGAKIRVEKGFAL